MKIMICGHARHGKDQLCEFMGITYRSSSEVAIDAVIWDAMGHNYSSKEECFEDRVNHRTEWYNLIKEFNTPDRTRLAREILSTNDVYCGIRDREEFLQARAEGLFDLAIWVDASKRMPLEPAKSISLKATDCDIIIDNNGTLDELRSKADALKKALSPALETPLRDLITEWADKVFPDRTVQNAIQKLMMEELPEYLLDRGNALELGDLGVLLYDIAHLDGVDLDAAIRAKMEINLGRTWGIDPTTGLLNHTNVENFHGSGRTPASERSVKEEDPLNTDRPTAKCPHCGHLNAVGYAKQRALAIRGDIMFQCAECGKLIKIKVVQGVNHVRKG